MIVEVNIKTLLLVIIMAIGLFLSLSDTLELKYSVDPNEGGFKILSIDQQSIADRVIYFENEFDEVNKNAVLVERTVLLSEPFSDSEKLLELPKYEEIILIGENSFDYWKVVYQDKEYYIHRNSITTDMQIVKELKDATYNHNWTGPVLNARLGAITGPTGRETYYNLNMDGVLAIMRRMGNTDKYWIRDDGVKMLGDYVMVAANFDLFPRGSLVECSLGTGIVCDTGGFAATNPTQLDIAVNW
ncbi:MAG TPA: hypothetical protein PLI19_00230 [Erysipelotrichaceae bacterium]|nr:hypothetical protein [Erysipelotrichaceae bacterium]HQB31732.1 hypothetical protein [Erysipelotrichaceae bacterium]